MAGDWITFELTDRCQLCCVHCLRDPSAKPKDLPLPLIRKALEDAKTLLHSHHAAFTGGEPTLHPQFDAVVDCAVDLGYTWHMVTNGHHFQRVIEMLNQRPLRRERLRSFTISVDGADEATHDAVRGKGSFRQVMTAVSLCTAHGIPFVFNSTLHARNAHQLEAMGLLAAQLGADRISYVMLCATGSPADAELALSDREWRRVMDRIDRIAEALRIPVSVPEGYYREQPWHVCNAFAGQQIHVDVEGRVLLCCQHASVPRQPGEDRDIAGDLREMSLADACQRFLDIVHRFQVEKMAAMARGELDDGWDRFPCNYCMKHFGKPYWKRDGVGGPPALRSRRKKGLPVVG